MKETPALSVVVASHGRPRALRRCLLGLSQSRLRRMEVIVVADAAGLRATSDLAFADRLKTVPQAEPNLSAARNDGVARAAGDVVAFIDDDAVPEPTWAGALAEAFARDADLAAATGPVLGRNGISVQWGRMSVDRQGRDGPFSERLPAGAVLKLHGTNMAVRRDVLHDLGGFDPAFRFYLDDTDLALRLGQAGHRAVWVPRAQVHHAFAPSERRDAERVPLSLFDIGASTASFLRKHAPDEMEAEIARLAEDQRARLFRLVRRRKLGAQALERLTSSLRDGIAEGRGRPVGARGPASQEAAWIALHDGPSPRDEVLWGWRTRARPLRAEAARRVAAGARVSLFLFEPTPRAHRVRFDDGGWWEQTGGLYGRSERTMPRIQAWRFDSRLFSEIRRIGDTRFGEGGTDRFREDAGTGIFE
ncbi:glycosyltransferase [Roseibacterium sp. SDUM158017]|uniref:glycosyltransferase family 2 protein n=1 Tax=Roseicyclus salinarum TaxID=3036773 RepID=UPI002414F016|nr:glycosyltransferase [Roseibacterium sp. SDUM158017]MDG4646979.1 glycosyltransferase [Roseibacterium sp. SDUM158017]